MAMELAELRELADAERAAQERVVRVRCCTAAGCVSSGSHAVRDALGKAVVAGGLADAVHVAPVGCMKLCCEGPLVQVDPGGPLYERVTAADAPAIVARAAGRAGGGNPRVQRSATRTAHFSQSN